MKIIAAIPARYQSTRLPGKLMANLGGQTVISCTVENTKAMEIFDEVVVVTDSDEISKELEGRCKVYKSRQKHICGTDRIAEFSEEFDADIVINVQGDEPFLKKADIQSIIIEFEEDQDRKIDVISLRHEISKEMERRNPNYVKVVSSLEDYALYFSRSNIPFRREQTDFPTYRHIGIYAFRKDALVRFSKQKPTPLEKLEVIEALRILEMGMKFKMLDAKDLTIGIDTEEDLIWANEYLEQ